MPLYEWTRSDPFKDYANDRVVEEGEVVEISDDIAEPAYGFVEADEPDANPGGNASKEGEDEPTCAGNDGECSRTVDEPGGRCWQHPEEE